jgi:hypothetical protein
MLKLCLMVSSVMSALIHYTVTVSYHCSTWIRYQKNYILVSDYIKKIYPINAVWLLKQNQCRIKLIYLSMRILLKIINRTFSIDSFMSIEQYKECGVLHTFEALIFIPSKSEFFYSSSTIGRCLCQRVKLVLFMYQFPPPNPQVPWGWTYSSFYVIYWTYMMCTKLDIYDFMCPQRKKLHKSINVLLTDDVSNQMS